MEEPASSLELRTQKGRRSGFLFSGFTIVEVMIVMLVIGILSGLGYSSIQKIRTNARTKLCLNNLRLIRDAKERFAMDNNIGSGAEVNAQDILSYLKGSGLPTEPEGGVYTVGVVDSNPSCSVGGGHTL